ncbi:MAG: hypothetical protein JXB42_07245 [Deltaproteobacteria bacterium]|nr:hypothetical protein [Deltaproteobacteria bacterium]
MKTGIKNKIVRKVVFTLILICILVLLISPMSSANDGKYVCKCKGIPSWWPLWTIYTSCGNSFIGSDKDQIDTEITEQNPDVLEKRNRCNMGVFLVV